MKNEWDNFVKASKLLITRNEFLFVLFIIFGVLELWPFMVVKNMNNPIGFIIYFYCVWALNIFTVFFILTLKKKKDK